MVTKGYLVRYSINNKNSSVTYMTDFEVKIATFDNVSSRAEKILKKIAEIHFKNYNELVDWMDIAPILLAEI